VRRLRAVLLVPPAELAEAGLELLALFQVLDNPRESRHELLLLLGQLGREHRADRGDGGEDSVVKVIGKRLGRGDNGLKARAQARGQFSVGRDAVQVEVGAERVDGDFHGAVVRYNAIGPGKLPPPPWLNTGLRQTPRLSSVTDSCDGGVAT
jgi:hypothetical protein